MRARFTPQEEFLLTFTDAEMPIDCAASASYRNFDRKSANTAGHVRNIAFDIVLRVCCFGCY